MNPVRSRCSSFIGTCQNHWQSRVVKYLDPCKEAVASSKTDRVGIELRHRIQCSEVYRYFGVPSALFLGTKIAGADQGELLGLMTPLWSMFSTCVFISFVRAYGVLYWGRLMGRASPIGISCSITLVPLKSFVSSSWKTWAYFNSIGSITSLSSWFKWSNLPFSSLRYKASFFFFLWGLSGESEFGSFLIYSISGSDASSAIPRTGDLGTVSAWSLKLASMTYALVLRDLTAFWSARDVMRAVLLGLHSTRVSARAGRTPSMGMCAGWMHTRGGGSCSCSRSNVPITTSGFSYRASFKYYIKDHQQMSFL